jgi:hypothetical protein
MLGKQHVFLLRNYGRFPSIHYAIFVAQNVNTIATSLALTRKLSPSIGMAIEQFLENTGAAGEKQRTLGEVGGRAHPTIGLASDAAAELSLQDLAQRRQDLNVHLSTFATDKTASKLEDVSDLSNQIRQVDKSQIGACVTIGIPD